MVALGPDISLVSIGKRWWAYMMQWIIRCANLINDTSGPIPTPNKKFEQSSRDAQKPIAFPVQ